jgi:hypothetical protein
MLFCDATLNGSNGLTIWTHQHPVKGLWQVNSAQPMETERLREFGAFFYKSIAASMAMTAITTNNSINVNAFTRGFMTTSDTSNSGSDKLASIYQ